VTGRSRLVGLLLLLAVAGMGWYLSGGSPGSPDSPVSSRTSGSVATDPVSGLARVDAMDLPQEARHVLEQIDAGGPFDYDRDGVVFENREAILPDEDRGYYHEYTVETPGSGDRGPRRIVTGGPAGAPTEYYWTDDHYRTFERIER
jgi:ribonuclease T1